MRCFILATAAVGICVLGCSQPHEAPVAPPDSSNTSPEAAGTPYGDYVIGTPVSYENLTIFPISSKTPKQDDRFITLDEGLAAGTVEIIEVGAQETDSPSTDDADLFGAGPTASELNQSDAPLPEQSSRQTRSPPDGEQTLHEPTVDEDLSGDQSSQSGRQVAGGARQSVVEPGDDLFGPSDAEADDNPFGSSNVEGDVNTLMVLNTSDKPLYLMPGEVISGGKQDRTIGQEMVIAPSDKPVPIDVFCVEHGRWGGRSTNHTTSQLSGAANLDSSLSLVTSQTASVAELAEDAQRGKFVASVGQLNKDARLAVQGAGAQAQVWEEVAKTNSKVGNDSDSGNFAANYMSGEVAKDFEPFVKQLTPLGETTQIVGVAVAVNGKILSVDTFESTPLFKKFWPKLLKSYALDAVAEQSAADATEKSKPITLQDCLSFLRELEKSKVETETLTDGQKTDKRNSPLGISHSYYDTEAASAARAAAGAAATGYGGGAFGGVHTSVLAK